MKIFIAGKVFGLLYEEVTQKFEKAEQELRAAGWEPVNPMKLGIAFDAQMEEALRVCIPEMRKCKAIYMLNDWRDSVEAIIEHSFAKHEKMDSFYEEWHPMVHMQKVKAEVL